MFVVEIFIRKLKLKKEERVNVKWWLGDGEILVVLYVEGILLFRFY